MNKKLPADTTKENAQELLKKINLEAKAEIDDINAIAQREIEKIFTQARQEVESEKAISVSQLQKELETLREKNFSTIALEKKKVLLGEKNLFIEKVFRAVQKEAESFRSCAHYKIFLQQAIFEAVEIIDADTVIIFCSSLDEGTCNAAFIAEIENVSAAKFKKTITFIFQKGSFADIGIIAQSKDGHLRYDNRFAARLRRVYDDMYVKLQREIV